jgi:hypothetical protein
MTYLHAIATIECIYYLIKDSYFLLREFSG